MRDDEMIVDLGAVPITALSKVGSSKALVRIPRATLAAVTSPVAEGTSASGGAGIRAEYTVGELVIAGALLAADEQFILTRTIKPLAVRATVVDDAGAAVGVIQMTQLDAGDDTLKPGPGAIPQNRLDNPFGNPVPVIPKLLKAGSPLNIAVERNVAPGAGLNTTVIVTLDCILYD